MKMDEINKEKIKLLNKRSNSINKIPKYPNKYQFDYPIQLNQENNLNDIFEKLRLHKIQAEHIKESNSIKNIYYIPVCIKQGCEGHLRITIDEEKFMINGICQKNKEHIFNNIYFETFERCYLKENKIQNCFKCSNNLENKYKFVCDECKNIYCQNCFISDIHIKKDIQKLKFITNRCSNCQNELIKYCTDCGEKICLICSKKNEKNNPHENHNIINILDMIPSKNQINNLKEKIIKKSDDFYSMIRSLNEWQNELNKKIERIKQNLKNEISLIKKLFLNFNCEYMDYTYFTNFNEFFKSIDNYKKTFLNQFMEGKNFQEKTRYLFDLLMTNNKDIEAVINKPKLKEYFYGYNFEKFTEQYCICYSKQNRYISLLYDNKIGFRELPNSQIDFYDDIFCFNFSPDRKKIYVCLAKRKSLNIINYDSEKKTLKFDGEIISICNPGHFNKCIHINDNCLLIIDDFYIYLFNRDKFYNKKLTNTKKINLDFQLFDICPIDDKYAIVSQKTKLTFIKMENLEIEKEINNIDCIEKYNNLTMIKDCVLVNCKKGIAIISIKTRELIKFIHDDENLGKKKIVKSFNNYIYSLHSLGYLLKYSFNEYNLILKEKIKIEVPNKTNPEFFYSNKNFLFFNDNIYLYVNKIYILEK